MKIGALLWAQRATGRRCAMPRSRQNGLPLLTTFERLGEQLGHGSETTLKKPGLNRCVVAP